MQLMSREWQEHLSGIVDNDENNDDITLAMKLLGALQCWDNGDFFYFIQVAA